MNRITPSGKVAAAGFQVLAAATLFVAVLILSSCGGGGGGGVVSPPLPSPDFTLTMQPANVTVVQGSSASVTVGITGLNGFSSQVSIAVTGTPSGVTVSPAQFTLASGGQQAVTINAATTAAAASATLTVTATSGSLTHAGPIALVVSVPPDFTLTIQPTSVSLVTGSSASVAVSLAGLNGFASQATVTITGMPAGVTATPSDFNLSASGQETVTLSADSMAATGSATLTVTATSGSLNHSGQIALAVVYPQPSAFTPIRTRYVRTDALWDPDFVLGPTQPWVLYDSVTKRFFVSNTELNRVDVIDAASELKIGEITVPGAWSGDVSLDHKTIYMGTQIGDIYEIDPVALAVTKRIPALQIGPSGYQAFEVRAMADGNLALLGGQGGIAWVDGYGDFAVWNPADNSLEIFTPGNGTGESWGNIVAQPANCDMGNVFQFALTADRTKILLGSGNELCMFDPSTLSPIFVQTGGAGPFLVPPDGQAILAGGHGTVNVYDGSGFFLTDQFQVGSGTGTYYFGLSSDGSTLFAESWQLGEILAYNWKTHQQIGWVPNFLFGDSISMFIPQVVDETGLYAGIMGHGVVFIDTGVIEKTTSIPEPGYGGVQPATGPVAGGTQVQVTPAPSTAALSTFFIGNQSAVKGSLTSTGAIGTTPVGSPGAADISVTTADGALTLVPETFSYGPTILEAVPNASTAEGGGTGFIYGYGFGPVGQDTVPTGLTVTVGGRPATITNYAGGAPYSPYPFPIQFVEFTFPPGTAGSNADVTVTSSTGSTTVNGAIQYLPATQQYSLPGAALYQGIYDSKRDVYYFTDQTQIRVFSPTAANWLPSISIPKASRLYGIALSPNGTLLAVGDPLNDVIYVFDPDTPSAISTFPLPNTVFDSGALPCGVAVTDSGIVYYATYDVNGTGDDALHKLNTSTGQVSDYSDFSDVGPWGQDAYIRLLLTSDNKRLYFTLDGYVTVLDTATDTTFTNPIVEEGDDELAVSSNQTWMSAAEYMMDTNLNPESYVGLNEREVWNQSAVYGEKMSPDGNLLFAPLINSIDVYDGRTGEFRTRVALPFALSANYDALVSDGIDNVLVAITGQTGDGIAVIDLTSLSEPLPLPYSSVAQDNLKRMAQGTLATMMKRAQVQSAQVGANRPGGHPPRIPHRMNPFTVPLHTLSPAAKH